MAEAQITSAFELVAEANATYRQTAPRTVNFTGGSFDISLRDGFFVYTCASQFYFPPTRDCPIGANAQVTRGVLFDPLTLEALPSLGAYISLVQLNPAKIVDPFQPERISLLAAPISALPRTLTGFTALPTQIFDFRNVFAPRQYSITNYEFSRPYNSSERNRFNSEIVPGLYYFNFPALTDPNFQQPVAKDVVLPVTITQQLDGFRKVNNQEVGFRFTNERWENGFLLIDARLPFTFTWQGNSPAILVPSADRMFVSINRLADPNDPNSDRLTGVSVDPREADPAGDPDPPLDFPLINNVIFPGFIAPALREILLPSPLVTQYTLPPFATFGAGTTSGVLQVRIEKNRRAGVGREASNYIFQVPVRFINTFSSFASTSLPATTTAKDLAADADPDGDGFSNFEEWVFESNPADSSSAPISPQLSKVSSGNGTVAKSSTADKWEFKVTKLIDPVPALTYIIERSTDMKTWTQVPTWDPEWETVDTATEIKIVSRNPALKGGSFFRSRTVVK